jgi:hypothetical protein
MQDQQNMRNLHQLNRADYPTQQLAAAACIIAKKGTRSSIGSKLVISTILASTPRTMLS